MPHANHQLAGAPNAVLRLLVTSNARAADDSREELELLETNAQFRSGREQLARELDACHRLLLDTAGHKSEGATQTKLQYIK